MKKLHRNRKASGSSECEIPMPTKYKISFMPLMHSGSKSFLLFVFLTVVTSSVFSGSKKFNVDGYVVDNLLYDEEFFANIKQPIDFSHKTHAGDNKISCEYCHTDARKSSVSGIPPVRTCIGCHAVIQGTTEEQKTEIAKVKEYWEKKEPIPWQKIHDLPDHVKFSHEVHLKKSFDCTSCHGDVSKVKHPVPQRIQGEIPLSMGWCITCHRTDWGLNAENKVALPIRKTRGGEIIGEAPEQLPDSHLNGPLDCLVCHR